MPLVDAVDRGNACDSYPPIWELVHGIPIPPPSGHRSTPIEPASRARGAGLAGTSGRARREGHALTLAEIHSLTAACKGQYRWLVLVLALTRLRCGELASLQVGDRVSVPGPGVRLTRTVLASGGGGSLYEDTLKNNRARTVPRMSWWDELVPNGPLIT